MTAAHRGPDRPALSLVTPEDGPLSAFGTAASAAVGELLAGAGIEVLHGRYAASLGDGELRLVPSGSVRAERAVTLPRLHGQHVAGLPTDHEGFLPTDRHGLVRGTEDVYAAGDATAFPVKHGGIAIQQASAVAEAIAARLGAPIRPEPFRPLLRGLLLTGDAPRFLVADPAGGVGETSTVAARPLWWPPGKIAGGRLADFLCAEGLPVEPLQAGAGALPVEVELSAV
jgi:sulfide:quinone oxidoreductase